MRTKATAAEGIKPCCYQKKDEGRAQKAAAMESMAQLALGSHMININVIPQSYHTFISRLFVQSEVLALLIITMQCDHVLESY